MPYVTAAVIAGTAIYGAIDASSRKKKAKKGIEELKKMQPKYRSAKEIQTEAEAAIQEGYSPQEVAAFNQSLARGGNAAYRLATQRNPNLTGAIQAGLNYANVGARTQFAAQDANLRRQKVREYASRVTGQSNAQTSADIQSKREQEIAYGNAKSQANADIYNSLMQLAYAGGSAAQAYNANKKSNTDEEGSNAVYNPYLINQPPQPEKWGTPPTTDYSTLMYRKPMMAAQPTPYKQFNPYANEQYASDINVPDQGQWISNPNSYNYYTK